MYTNFPYLFSNGHPNMINQPDWLDNDDTIIEAYCFGTYLRVGIHISTANVKYCHHLRAKSATAGKEFTNIVLVDGKATFVQAPHEKSAVTVNVPGTKPGETMQVTCGNSIILTKLDASLNIKLFKGDNAYCTLRVREGRLSCHEFIA